MSVEPVVVRIEVARPIGRVFAFYTEQMAAWWPLTSHSVGGEKAAFCGIEGRVGGRIFERDVAGEEHLWGTVLVWEPPVRMVHSWHPAHPGVNETEVSVHFRALDEGRTEVVLEHRGFEVLGERAETVRGNYDQGWRLILNDKFADGLAAAG